MIKEKTITQTVTVTEDVCELCKKKVVETNGLAKDDPSYKLQGYVFEDKAYHYVCINNKLL